MGQRWQAAIGRKLEFFSRVLELNSRFLPKAACRLYPSYTLPKRDRVFDGDLISNPKVMFEPRRLFFQAELGGRMSGGRGGGYHGTIINVGKFQYKFESRL